MAAQPGSRLQGKVAIVTGMYFDRSFFPSFLPALILDMFEAHKSIPTPTL
jgi:hypothetical protein